MHKRKILDLTTGSVAKKLLLFAIPIILSNLMQHFYTAADRIVVGQFAENGTKALAAVGATNTAIVLLLGLFNGLAVGVNIVCANFRGAGQKTALRNSMHNAMLLSAVCGTALMIVGLLVTEPMLRLMNAPANLLNLASKYMRIYFLGVPTAMIYNFGAAILRAYGDTRRPMMILAVSGLLNVALNLLFVIVFEMGVAGVAVATVIAHLVNAVWILRILFNPKDEFCLSKKELKLSKAEAMQLIKIGVPCSLNAVAFNISNVVLQSTVNTFGEATIAGNVAADGVGGVMYQILVGFYTCATSFVGQNYGAGKYKRIDKGLLVGASCSMGAVIILGIFCILFPRQLLGIYNNDPSVIDAGIPKLLYYGWAYALFALSEVVLGCLRGIRKTAIPSIVNVAGICLTRVFWIWLIFPLKPTIGMVYLCYPISWGLSAAGLLVCYLYYRKTVFKKAPALT